MSDTSKLRQGLAHATAHKDSIDDARRQLVRKAEDQYDSLVPVINDWEQAVQAGRGGGVLASRRLRMLLDERDRLEAILHKHGRADGG